jgi:membrane protein required for colicin V production
MQLVWVDYGVLGLLGISALLGLLRGFVREVLSLAAWVAAVWVAGNYGDAFADHLAKFIEPVPLRKAAAFCIVLFGALIIGGIVAAIIGKLIASAGLSGTDRIVGLIFGLLRGVLLVAVLVLVAGLTPAPQSSWWKGSKLIPPFQALAVWVREQVPASWLANLNYR